MRDLRNKIGLLTEENLQSKNSRKTIEQFSQEVAIRHWPPAPYVFHQLDTLTIANLIGTVALMHDLANSAHK